jgi:hypothetical protein
MPYSVDADSILQYTTNYKHWQSYGNRTVPALALIVQYVGRCDAPSMVMKVWYSDKDGTGF